MKKFIIGGTLAIALLVSGGIVEASTGAIKGYFKDSGWWSANAEWAKDNGLMNGYGTATDGTVNFGGNSPITRGEMATVLKNISDNGFLAKGQQQPQDKVALNNRIAELEQTVEDLGKRVNKLEISRIPDSQKGATIMDELKKMGYSLISVSLNGKTLTVETTIPEDASTLADSTNQAVRSLILRVTGMNVDLVASGRTSVVFNLN